MSHEIFESWKLFEKKGLYYYMVSDFLLPGKW